MTLNPEFPVVEGRVPLTGGWSMELPAPCNRRIEDGDLVLWRPGLTAWIAVWNNDHGASAAARLADIRANQSPDAFDQREREVDGRLVYTYRLDESDADDERVPALYGFAFADDGHVQAAVYFDDEADAEVAIAMCTSLRWLGRAGAGAA